MGMLRCVMCVLAAMVGAGFASGREIFRFFSRWGAFSWPLIGLCAVSAGFMTHRALCQPERIGTGGTRYSRFFLLLLYLFVAGGMTASAGELAALTIPLIHARSMGVLCTLAGCLLFSRKPLAALQGMGYLLMPLLMLAWALCFRVPADATQKGQVLPSWQTIAGALALVVFYCAMNVTLAAGVLREIAANCPEKQRKRLAAGVAVAFAALLCLGNGAVLPHAQALSAQPLPTVILLREFGKAGFYLSAAVLYLAVASTLIAALKSARDLLPDGCPPRLRSAVLFAATALIACLGFGDIVAYAYPILGAAGLTMLMHKKEAKA